jgi:hypothetical protein
LSAAAKLAWLSCPILSLDACLAEREFARFI